MDLGRRHYFRTDPRIIIILLSLLYRVFTNMYLKKHCSTVYNGDILWLHYMAGLHVMLFPMINVLYMSGDNVVWHSDSLRTGRSEDRIPVGARFSSPRQGRPSLLYNGYRVSFPGVNSRVVALTTHCTLAPTLKSRAIPLLVLWAFMACCRVNKKKFLYFFISTFRSMCAVRSMAVLCSSLMSCFSGILLRCFLNTFEMVPCYYYWLHFCFYIPRALYFNCTVFII